MSHAFRETIQADCDEILFFNIYFWKIKTVWIIFSHRRGRCDLLPVGGAILFMQWFSVMKVIDEFSKAFSSLTVLGRSCCWSQLTLLKWACGVCFFSQTCDVCVCVLGQYPTEEDMIEWAKRESEREEKERLARLTQQEQEDLELAIALSKSELSWEPGPAQNSPKQWGGGCKGLIQHHLLTPQRLCSPGLNPPCHLSSPPLRPDCSLWQDGWFLEDQGCVHAPRPHHIKGNADSCSFPFLVSSPGRGNSSECNLFKESRRPSLPSAHPSLRFLLRLLDFLRPAPFPFSRKWKSSQRDAQHFCRRKRRNGPSPLWQTLNASCKSADIWHACANWY